MNLIISIILSGILGWILLMMGPLVASIIAFGIVAGSLFRGLYLLNEIHKRLLEIAPKQDKSSEAYLNYLKEKENKAQG